MAPAGVFHGDEDADPCAFGAAVGSARSGPAAGANDPALPRHRSRRRAPGAQLPHHGRSRRAPPPRHDPAHRETRRPPGQEPRQAPSHRSSLHHRDQRQLLLVSEENERRVRRPHRQPQPNGSHRRGPLQARRPPFRSCLASGRCASRSPLVRLAASPRLLLAPAVRVGSLIAPRQLAKRGRT